MSRVREVLVALDQMLNALTGGYAGETVSARAHRLRWSQPFTTIRHVLDVIALRVFRQADHCKGSYQSIRDRVHLPAEYRQ